MLLVTFLMCSNRTCDNSWRENGGTPRGRNLLVLFIQAIGVSSFSILILYLLVHDAMQDLPQNAPNSLGALPNTSEDYRRTHGKG
jgi:hypothetical protein